MRLHEDFFRENVEICIVWFGLMEIGERIKIWLFSIREHSFFFACMLFIHNIRRLDWGFNTWYTPTALNKVPRLI